MRQIFPFLLLPALVLPYAYTSETCDIVVRNMVFKEDDATGNTGSRARIPSVNYQDWWVEALAKVVGLNSIDDLTEDQDQLGVHPHPNLCTWWR